MKFIKISHFAITTCAIALFMATSCSAEVCWTFSPFDNHRGDSGVHYVYPPTEKTTAIECAVDCVSATSVRVTMYENPSAPGDRIVDETTSCGTTISHTTTNSAPVGIGFEATDNINLVFTCRCNDLSTPAPYAYNPYPTPPPPPFCFSEEATVEQPGQAPTKMTELKIGDKILTANNEYQPIYAFAHNDATTYTEFLQIHTTSGNNPLEITSQHLVYVQGKDAPVTAGSIKVGDTLTEAGQGGAAVVTKIDTVQRHGIYAPLTPDGTLVVDGIASSCYVSLQPNGDPQTMELKGCSALSVFSHHRVAHMLLTVPRLVCMGGINPKWCQTYNEDGVALFVQTAFDLSDWFHAQHWVVQRFLLAVYLVVLCPMYALELLLGTKLAAAMVVGGLGFVGFVRGNNAPAAEPTDVNKQA
ncbi:expressed unknown protein [Seminavis robusta]|uniref:Hint domain-containing protein n=1 Tax=Seminavis robusta TaxID=568900 RepID=A0A9N8DYG8_9STRA|nr:expressed unknown protein [Seminavis robusta]|eukprot:Sro476_g150511.1  (415) ;mRNA; r:7462-8706